MYLKPAPGLKVPDLMLRDFLPEEGRDVVPSDYWTRRLLDKDVVEAEAPATPAAEPQAEAAPAAADQGYGNMGAAEPQPAAAKVEAAPEPTAPETSPSPAPHEETQP